MRLDIDYKIKGRRYLRGDLKPQSIKAVFKIIYIYR